jgi:hypothetical protein
MLRAGAVMFCASAPFALLPSVAHQLSGSAVVYGVLLGCVGVGAVVGAVGMQRARARWSTEAIGSAAVVMLGGTIVAIGRVHNLPGLALVMLVNGGTWIVFISLASALVQSLAPDWVRARVLAIYMLISQGGLAAGSVVWGVIASRTTVDTAFLVAGAATIAMAGLGLVARLPDTTGDVSPWNHWRMPAIAKNMGPDLDQGPVLVTAEYRVEERNAIAFLEVMEEYGHLRKRDGAFRWGIYRDIEKGDVYVETFLISSWAEHLRQHDRLTRADSELEERVLGLGGDPLVRHLIYAEAED